MCLLLLLLSFHLPNVTIPIFSVHHYNILSLSLSLSLFLSLPARSIRMVCCEVTVEGSNVTMDQWIEFSRGSTVPGSKQAQGSQQQQPTLKIIDSPTSPLSSLTSTPPQNACVALSKSFSICSAR